ncbi:hypothetical protein C2S52_005960 [Perilla frutescens var. hirtella]|nr:hypothetical protein C2S52_005960 [Perilla frutescens var. hirtella]
MIVSRSSATTLVNALKRLTGKQMKEVNDMGFGLLVHLRIEKVPTRIAYWVVDNFDARRSEINLQDGKRLHIEAADVHRVLGFLNSDRPIVRKKRRKSIVAKDVAKEMLKHIHGGEGLVEHKIMWEKNEKKNFSGPMLFLIAFYVDRVVLYSKTVVREFPTMKNWTHLLMKNRENAEIKSDGFGGGYPREPIPIVLDMFAERFMQKAKLLAITMVEIIAMVDGAPQQLADEEFLGNPNMIAMIEEIESAMLKRNEFIKNLPDGPSFSLGLTQEEDAGLEYENEYFDFSLRDDDTEEVQFVRSGNQSIGIVINDNGNADGAICDKQRLEKDQMEEHLYDYLPGESDQSKRKREITQGDDTYAVLQDVERFHGFTSVMSKEKEIQGPTDPDDSFLLPLPNQVLQSPTNPHQLQPLPDRQQQGEDDSSDFPSLLDQWLAELGTSQTSTRKRRRL